MLGETRRQQFYADKAAAVSKQQHEEAERRHQSRATATLRRHQEVPEVRFPRPAFPSIRVWEVLIAAM